MSNQTDTERDSVPPFYMPMAEVPPSTFISTRMAGKEDDADIIALSDMVKRLRANGDSPYQYHDIWHTAHFGSTENADCFVNWLDGRSFCSIFRCHLDETGWLVSAFNHGSTDLTELIKWYCMVRDQVQESGGRYMEIRVRVMGDETG
ncbi:ribonuclease E inhibitor RraB [Paraburkholderia fungorum]|uniref:ribonuclease E inhibitor RraB n=1 Tax=Paraburkholderia fungorum TaxID=134537 RepID=UPI0038B925EE